MQWAVEDKPYEQWAPEFRAWIESHKPLALRG